MSDEVNQADQELYNQLLEDCIGNWFIERIEKAEIDLKTTHWKDFVEGELADLLARLGRL